MNIIYGFLLFDSLFTRLLKDKDLNINYFIYFLDKNKLIKNLFKDKEMFLDWIRTEQGEYNVDWNTIEPLDKKILSQLHSCETIFLKMIGRKEKGFGTWSYEKRKDIYLKHVRFWRHILITKKIDLFLLGNIPHEGFGYVIYSLCKLLDIPVLFIHQTIPEFLYFINDLDDFFPELQNTYQEFLQSNKEVQLEPNSRAERLFLLQTSKINKPTPFYMKKNPISIKEIIKKKKRQLVRVFKILSSSYFYNMIFQLEQYSILFYRIIGRRILGIRSITLRLFYERCCEKPNLDANYVYFPLHLQPELSTCPLAWDYVDQSLIVSLVSQCLPGNVKIYVKENPKQDRFYRSKSFYKKLMRTKNVILISRKFDTYTLINHCSCVVTATGTAGWEAIFREKPVLLFGITFYQYAPGVYRIETVEDCKKAIKEIFEHNKKPEIDKVKKFVKAFEQNTIPVYYSEEYNGYNIVLGGDSPLYGNLEENINKIFVSLKERILQSVSTK